MKRITLKLARIFIVAALVYSAGATAANSQQGPTARKRQPSTTGTVTSIDNYGKRDVAVDKAYADALVTGRADPQYEELRCRGGAGLRFVEVEGRTNSSGEQTNYMTVYFKPAAQGTPYGRNLQPGQCAFTDRAVRSNEPYEIILEIVYFGQTRQQLHGSAVDTSPTAAERFPDAQNVPKYLADPNHYWRFYVHQNAPLPNGRFEASGGGRYWKPSLSSQDIVVPFDSKIADKSNPYTIIPKKP
jgi:hypothetical protein